MHFPILGNFPKIGDFPYYTNLLIIKSIHNGDILHKDVSTENIQRYKFQGPEEKDGNKFSINEMTC